MNMINNDKGSAIIAALLMTLALSLAVFIAMDNSLSNSKMMRSNREYTDNLYKAETGITVAVEEHQTTWLSSASTLFSDTTGNATEGNPNVTIVDENAANMTLASYVVGRIQSSPAVGSFSENFN